MTIAALYRRVRSNPTLRRICELAGRFRRVAQSRQRRKAAQGLDDVVGVVTDGDLGRLLPQELAKLAIPEFEDDTLRRLVERQLMCREYRSMEPVGKGPILCHGGRKRQHGRRQGPHRESAGPGPGVDSASATALVRVNRVQRQQRGALAGAGTWPLERSCRDGLVGRVYRPWQQFGCARPGTAGLLPTAECSGGQDRT